MDIQSYWANDMKILKAAYGGIQSSGSVRLGDLVEATGLEPEFVYYSVGRLLKAGYFREGDQIFSMGLNLSVHRSNMTERGLRQVGAWPSLDEFRDALVRAFEGKAASESEPKQQGVLRAVAKMLGSEDGKAVIMAAVGELF